MNKYLLRSILLLLVALLLVGCSRHDPLGEDPSQAGEPLSSEDQPNDLPPPDVSDVPDVPDPPENSEDTPPPPPEHSPLYIPGVPVEDVIRYFNEVCLDAEFVNSGNASLLQKWAEPIYYTVNGNPTDQDLAVLEDFVSWLNTIEGFPGIYPTQDRLAENLQIYFCTGKELLDRMGDQFIGTDGAVTFWYLENKIYDCTICYRTDILQITRNSVILEEIYNGLGPVQDTDLRPDSIIYTGYSEPQSLTPVDELLLKLLYHPQLECGMDATACEAVIRQLYY